MLCYVLDIDIWDFCKPLKVVLTLPQKLLRQGYITQMSNYYISLELSDLMN
jgi:hypothetical protein